MAVTPAGASLDFFRCLSTFCVPDAPHGPKQQVFPQVSGLGTSLLRHLIPLGEALGPDT